MKSVTYSRYLFSSYCALILVALMPLARPAYAQYVTPFADTHQLGLRIGGWANLGDTPPASDSAGNFQSKIGSGSAYAEAYVAWRMFAGGFAEVDLGIVSRGSVTLVENGNQYIGNLQVTPLLLQFKYYPLLGTDSKIFPFITAGGGVYFGRRTVQFTTDSYAAQYGDFNDNSQTEFNYVFGGGVDYRIAKSFALEIQGKYMPIKFNNLVQVKDYTALTITIGVKYLYLPSKQKPPRGGPHHESRN